MHAVAASSSPNILQLHEICSEFIVAQDARMFFNKASIRNRTVIFPNHRNPWNKVLPGRKKLQKIFSYIVKLLNYNLLLKLSNNNMKTPKSQGMMLLAHFHWREPLERKN